MPECGTLIDEKELALVNLTEEEHAITVRKTRKKRREKAAKFKNKSSTKTSAFSITNSTDNIKNTKKRSVFEINSGEGELSGSSRKLSKTNAATDVESDDGNDCGLPNSDEFSLSDAESFETNKNNPSMDDNTKQTIYAVNSSKLFEQGNDQIVLPKETSLNKSKTNSAIKIVKLALPVSKNNHADDKSKQPFHTISDRKFPKDNTHIVNKAMSSNESKTDPPIKIINIPLSLLENGKIFKIQMPSDICLNESSSSSPNTSTKTNFDLPLMQGNNAVLMTQQKNMVSNNIIIPARKTTIEPTLEISENANLPAMQGIKSTISTKKQNQYQELLKHVNQMMKPAKETITQPSLENISERDKGRINTLKAATAENKILTMELLQLQEEYENLLCSDESIGEKMSLYNIEELKSGITNADRKALFLYDQLCCLTEEKTMWSECTTEFADKLEEKLPACYNFLRKTNVINLPPSKQEREDNTSQTKIINIC